MERKRALDAIPQSEFDRLRRMEADGTAMEEARRIMASWQANAADESSSAVDWYYGPDGTYRYGR